MTREEIIEYWEQFSAEIDDLYNTCSDAERGILEKQREVVEFTISAIRELDAQEKLKPMNEWISVKDRLPEVPEGYERIQVIVRCCYGVDTAWVQRDTKKFYDIAGWLRSEVIGVTHWMPMPEPPKEKQK